MEGYVIYVIDTETTGLNHLENDVIEISACRLVLENDIREQKTWLLKAKNPKTISEEALKVNGHKREDILGMTAFGRENYLDPEVIVPEIELWIMEDEMSAKDRIFAGHNPDFDIAALQELWRRNGGIENFPFDLERGNRIIDTKQIAALYDVCTGKRRQFYNLTSLVDDFGIKKGKAHKASEDVRMTTDLLLEFMKPIKEPVKNAFEKCYSRIC